MTVTLEPMSAERFVSWNEQLVASYARDKVDAGDWPAEGALERSAKENADMLPQGVATPAHDLFVGVVDGQEVGHLWLFTDPALPVRESFIFDIEVAEEHRGQGHGRGILDAAEHWCAEREITALRLHVFGFNKTAITLYESAGYKVTSMRMMKRIATA